MKFFYCDESGGSDQGDVFVMSGLMVDAYRLRKVTAEVQDLMNDIYKIHDGPRKDFKTKKFIDGRGVWRNYCPAERQEYLKKMCELAVSSSSHIFAFALSFKAFESAKDECNNLPTGLSPWRATAMFLIYLIQKKMRKESRNKGLTVFIMDDNKKEIPRLTDELHDRNEWFDALYQVRTGKGKKNWKPLMPDERFDQIVNTVFAIKSDHSTLVQVADALSYIFRRHVELFDEEEAYSNEKEFYFSLVAQLEKKRAKLGHCPPDGKDCKEFYEYAKHPQWKL